MSKLKGKKFDQGKAPLDLIPEEALFEIGKVLAMGKAKYGAANWANGIEYSRLIAASKRHLSQFNMGIDLDEESSASHIAHSATNLLFLLWMIQHRPDLDDRWSKKVGKNETLHKKINRKRGNTRTKNRRRGRI